MTTNKPDVCLSDYKALQDDYQRLKDKYERLQDEYNSLRSKTGMSLGVGNGDGNLFVYGDSNSINHVLALIFECEGLREWQYRYRSLRAALFQIYGDKHISWHSLHIAMDDGNMRDSDVAFCSREAEKSGDLLGLVLAYLLLEVPESERDAMPSDVDLGRAWLEARDGDVVVIEAIAANHGCVLG